MRSKVPLVLMEQLVMVLVFALAAAVCVQAFVLADTLSRKNADRDQAVTAAENLAEVWKSCGGDEAAAAARYGGTAEQGAWRILYDQDWNVAGDGPQAAYEATLLETDGGAGLRRASVDVRGADGGAPIFSIEIACQEAMG